jgi:hypothetical protein
MPALAARPTLPYDVDNDDDAAFLARLPGFDAAVGSDAFLRAAGQAGRLLSEATHDALSAMGDDGSPAALRIRHLPIGAVGPTPATPLAATTKDHVSEFVLLTAARRLGQPVGYAPEHGGDLVQNLVPTAADTERQTSTSSGVELAFHTETAFHPFKPRYVLLLCLRGDPEALTLLCAVDQILGALPDATRRVLSEPRFRTGVDASFLGRDASGAGPLGPPMPVLTGPLERPLLTFDADLMVAEDTDAAAAIDELRAAVQAHHVGVSLEAGDLLVVDNATTVHGRSPFPARFDGTDRWLQRTFVVGDLAPSVGDRRGRVITTHFG